MYCAVWIPIQTLKIFYEQLRCAYRSTKFDEIVGMISVA